jgi:hypothetical protein
MHEDRIAKMVFNIKNNKRKIKITMKTCYERCNAELRKNMGGYY